MILIKKNLNLILRSLGSSNRRIRIIDNFKIIFILFLYPQCIFASEIQSSEPLNSGLFGKDLAKHNTEADISFRGDRGLKTEEFYSLTGNVFIQQDNTTLTAQTVRLYFSKNKPNDESSTIGKFGIDHIFAKGNVKISKIVAPQTPEFKASCDDITLLVPENKLILKGHAKIWRHDEFIHADIISINLNTGDISLQEPRGTLAAKKIAPQSKS